MSKYLLTESGAQMVGHSKGDEIVRSPKFDLTGFCGDGEVGFIIPAENIPTHLLDAHVFLNPTQYSEVCGES